MGEPGGLLFLIACGNDGQLLKLVVIRKRLFPGEQALDNLREKVYWTLLPVK
jgi:hypothetical protein